MRHPSGLTVEPTAFPASQHNIPTTSVLVYWGAQSLFENLPAKGTEPTLVTDSTQFL